MTDLCLAFLHRIATDTDVAKNLSNTLLDQAEVAWTDEPGTLGIWALLCKSLSLKCFC